MTELQTVTLCIEGEGRNPIPFAIIPFSWVQSYQGATTFKFPVPTIQPVKIPDSEDDTQVLEAEPVEIVEIFVDVQTLHLPQGAKRTRVRLWIKSGAEYLVHHPHVATYPEARALVVAGMN
jgi:hypothetical protein